MKIVFMGTPDFAVNSLNALLQAGHEIAAVFTREDKPKNRGMKMQPPPVKEAAIGHNINVYQPSTLRDGQAFKILNEIAPEAIVVAAYGRLLPKEILELPKYGCINVHASLLPKYRGASPINAAILNGEKLAGVTIMQMAEGLDTGDMLSRASIEIGGDSYGALERRLAELGAKLLCDTIIGIEQRNVRAEKQDDSLVSYAGLIKTEDARVDFSASCEIVSQKIRGYDPMPGAFVFLGGEKLKLFGAQAGGGSGAAGSILSCNKNGVTVACGSGAVLISEVQGVGGKKMFSDAFFRGHSKLLEHIFE